MFLIGKSLKKWEKEFSESGKWESFELVRETREGWLVEVKTTKICLVMELCRDGSAHIYDTHGKEASQLIQKNLNFLKKRLS